MSVVGRIFFPFFRQKCYIDDDGLVDMHGMALED